jgi:thiamine-monophosphate kinase
MRVEVTEDSLLGAVRKVLSGAGPEVVVPVGDDAAVVRPGSGDLILTTDALVEGSHFDLSLSTAREVGYKAIAVNVSDVAAMAGSPRFALCALTLSDAVDAAWAMELFGGMREACEEFACTLVGGNLARGSEISVTIAMTGEVSPGRAVIRSGARTGDVLVVTGELGGAAAGLRLARRGAPPGRPWSDEERDAIHRQARPTPRLGEAQVLARCGATAMIDISDGLTLDLSRLCAASDAGARLELERIRVHAAATREEGLGGGEDYELLATLPTDEAVARAAAELRGSFGTPLTAIGEIGGDDVVAVDAGGAERQLVPAGWDHFA